MKRVSSNSKIGLKEVENHYRSSRENYEIEGSESHLTYYREKYPMYMHSYYKMFNLKFKSYVFIKFATG